MDDRHLDRAIDTAAGELMAREPGSALSYHVMVRVQRRCPVAPRRFVWTPAAASIALCATIAFLLLDRVPATVAKLPQTVQLPVGQPAQTPDTPVVVARATAQLRPRLAVSTVPRITPTIDTTARDVSFIEPIETEPIVMSAIELPQLERETTLIDTLDIEPLTIEPLAASND